MIKNIVVCGIKYKVRYVNEIKKDLDLLGYVDIHNGIIWIKKSVKKEIQKQSLIHEILHIILELHNIKFPEKDVCSLAIELSTIKIVKEKKNDSTLS